MPEELKTESIAPAPEPTPELAPAAPPTPTVDPAGNEGDGGEKTFTQAELDSIVKRRLERAQPELEQVKEQAREQARLEIKEAQLLEDEKHKELAEHRLDRAKQAEAKLAEYERRQKVDQFLDKREMTDPDLRDIVRDLPGDVVDLAPRVEKLLASIEKMVDDRVNKRLDTKAPAKSPSARTEPMTLDQQIADATAKGDWATVKKLNFQKSNQLQRNAGTSFAIPGAPIPGQAPAAPAPAPEIKMTPI